MFKNFYIVALRNLKKGRIYSMLNIIGLSASLAAVIIISLYVKTELSADKIHCKSEQIYRVSYHQVQPTSLRTAVSAMPLGPALKNEFPQILDYVRINFPTQFYGSMLIRHNAKANYEKGIMFADTNFFDFFNYSFKYGDAATALTEPNSIVLTQEKAEFFFGDTNPVGMILNVEKNHSLKITGVIEYLNQPSHLAFDYVIPMKGMNNFLTNVFGNSENFTSNNSHTYVLTNPGFDPFIFEKTHLPNFINRHYDTPGVDNESPENIITRLDFVALRDIYFDTTVLAEIPQPEKTSIKGNKTYLLVFSLLAIFLLFIAAINYTNMAIAQSLRRSKETGIRKALGARKKEILFQHIGEAAVFVSISLFIALFLIELSLPAFNGIMNKTLSLSTFNSWHFAGFLLLLSLLLIVLSGIYPAFYLSALNPIKALRGEFQLKGKTINVKNILFGFQFLVSVFMVITTVMVYQQFSYMQKKDMGFRYDNMIDIALPKTEQVNKEKLTAFTTDLLQQPGVQKINASRGNPLPGNPIQNWGMEIQTNDGPRQVIVRVGYTDPEFLDFFDIPLLQGRNFSPNSQEDFRGKVLINEKAKNDFGWDDPTGKILSLGEYQFEVIGVFSDFHYYSLHQPIEPMMIIPVRTGNNITVAFDNDSFSENILTIQKVFEQHFPDYPVDYRSVDQQINRSIAEEKSTIRLMGIFTLFSLFISIVGLFGITAFTAEQKTKEIAIRCTFGANIFHVIVFLAKGLFPLLAAGYLIAIAGAYLYMDRWLSGFAYRIPVTPEPFLAGITITAIIAALTLAWHALKSTGTNPIEALKYR